MPPRILFSAVLLTTVICRLGAADAPDDHTGMDQGYRDELQGRNQPAHPGWVAQEMAASLRLTLGLSDAQTSRIEQIVKQHIPYAPGFTPAEAEDAWRRTTEGIREVLTPAQRTQFNLIPRWAGGGLTGASPWDELDQLDKLVHLAPAQKTAAFNVFLNARENLMESQAPEQADQALEIKKSKRDEIGALLTPAQRKIWKAAAKSKGGGKEISAEKQVVRLDAVVHLTAQEKAAVLAIYQDEIAAYQKLPEAERAAQLPKFRHEAETRIRPLLTAEQQKLLDAALDNHRKELDDSKAKSARAHAGELQGWAAISPARVLQRGQARGRRALSPLWEKSRHSRGVGVGWVQTWRILFPS